MDYHCGYCRRAPKKKATLVYLGDITERYSLCSYLQKLTQQSSFKYLLRTGTCSETELSALRSAIKIAIGLLPALVLLQI
jgi:hypothetical protein